MIRDGADTIPTMAALADAIVAVWRHELGRVFTLAGHHGRSAQWVVQPAVGAPGALDVRRLTIADSATRWAAGDMTVFFCSSGSRCVLIATLYRGPPVARAARPTVTIKIDGSYREVESQVDQLALELDQWGA